MKRVKDEKGVALLLALVLGLISVVFLAGVLMMIGSGARLSGIERTYTSAIEAAKGGADLICRLLRRGGVDVGDYAGVGWLTVRDQTCLGNKLERETQNWGCNPTCNVTSSDMADIINCYDISRSSFGDYDLYMKIVDTKHYQVGGKDVFLYTIHSLAISNKNPNEKAWITFLYKVEET